MNIFWKRIIHVSILLTIFRNGQSTRRIGEFVALPIRIPPTPQTKGGVWGGELE